MKKMVLLLVTLMLTLGTVLSLTGCGSGGDSGNVGTSSGDKESASGKQRMNQTAAAWISDDGSAIFPAFDGKEPIVIPNCRTAEISPDRKHVVYLTDNWEIYASDSDMQHPEMIAQLPVPQTEDEAGDILKVTNTEFTWYIPEPGEIFTSTEKYWRYEYGKEAEAINDDRAAIRSGNVFLFPVDVGNYDASILMPDHQMLELAKLKDIGPVYAKNEYDEDGNVERAYVWYLDQDGNVMLQEAEGGELRTLQTLFSDPSQEGYQVGISFDGEALLANYTVFEFVDRIAQFAPEKNFMMFRLSKDGEYIICDQKEYGYYGQSVPIEARENGIYLPVFLENQFDLNLAWVNENGEMTLVTPLDNSGSGHTDSFKFLDENTLAYCSVDQKLHVAQIEDGVLSNDQIVSDLEYNPLIADEGFRVIPYNFPKQNAFVLSDATQEFLIDYSGEKKVAIAPAGIVNFIEGTDSELEALALIPSQNSEGNELWKIDVEKALELSEDTYLKGELDSLGEKIADHVIEGTIDNYCKEDLSSDYVYFNTRTADGTVQANFYNGKKVVTYNIEE